MSRLKFQIGDVEISNRSQPSHTKSIVFLCVGLGRDDHATYLSLRVKEGSADLSLFRGFGEVDVGSAFFRLSNVSQ